MIALDNVGDHVVGEALAVHALNTACKRASMFRHHRHRIQSRCLGKLNSKTNQGFGACGVYSRAHLGARKNGAKPLCGGDDRGQDVDALRRELIETRDETCAGRRCLRVDDCDATFSGMSSPAKRSRIACAPSPSAMKT